MTQEAEKDFMQEDVLIVAFKTAGKTLYCLFILVAFVLMLISQIFPLKAMRFFRDIGNDGNALEFAKLAAKQDSNNAFAIVNMVELSDQLLNNALNSGKKYKKYANELYNATNAYIALRDYDKYNKAMDDYNHQGAENTLQLIALYRYSDYISRQSFKAATILGQADKMLINDQFESISQITLSLNNMDLDCLAAVFYMVGEYTDILADNYPLLSDANGLTDFYMALMQNATSFIDQSHEMSLIYGEKRIEGLYYLNAALRLKFALYSVTLDDIFKQQLESIFSIEGQPLFEYFSSAVAF